MTTYNTGNPVPSKDPRDLLDNAENADLLENGPNPSYPDRLGVSRKSRAGMESDFATDQSERATTFANFLASSGYVGTGTGGAIEDYAGGIEITEYNQLIRESGEFYRAKASLPLPYTTTGTWVGDDETRFVSVGDAALRQEIGSGIFRADSLANLESTPGRFDGDAARLVSGTGRDGDFRWDSSDLSATLVLASATSDSVDDTTDTINDAAHPFSDGDGVITQTTVNGLTAQTVYWVVNSTAGTYQLSATFGGGAVDLTGTTNVTIDKLLDPRQLIWITPASDRTGSSGAWMRTLNGAALAGWANPEKDGAILNFGYSLAYSVSGSDDSASLNVSARTAIDSEISKLKLQAGFYYSASDVKITPATLARSNNGFVVSGEGRGSSWSWEQSTNKFLGTAVMFAPDSRFVFGESANGSRIEDLAITGAVQDGSLVASDYEGPNDFVNYSGGFSNVLVLNHLVASPSGDPSAIELNSLYTSYSKNLDVVGVAGYSSKYNDAAISSSDLYYGRGLLVNRSGLGGGGTMEQLNIRGFRTGFECGLTHSDWASDPDQFTMDNIEFSKDFQVQYCNEGVKIGVGVSTVYFNNPFFEQNADYNLKVIGINNRVIVDGGTSNANFRTGPGGNEYTRLGSIVAGDTSDSESQWGSVVIRNHDFQFVGQAGVVVFGGTDSGEVILDGCVGRYNGGCLVGLETTNGIPDVLIKNWGGASGTNANEFVSSRFVCDITIGADYTRHTYADARWKVRMENCPGFDDDIILPSTLDLTSRKYIPSSGRFDTISTGATITLGNLAVINDILLFEKRNLNNSVDISVPAGFKLKKGDGTVISGATTLSVSAIGFYWLRRIADSVWETDAV